MSSADLDQLEAALAASGIDTTRAAPLARLGFWRIGGPADLFAEIADAVALAHVVRAAASLGLPVTVLGNGSNLLVADAGVRGLVVRLVGGFRESGPIAPGADRWVVGAGLMNAVLLVRLKKAGRGGLACLAGIPGTLGGAVRMNAGWSAGEIRDRVAQVEVVTPDGAIARWAADDLDFGYRRARLPAGAILTRVWLDTTADPAAIAQEAALVKRYLARRKATQPLSAPSCGSVFKNPPGDHAGRLVEAAGLKGRAHGGAQISDKHANFIVNTGGATAADVLALITVARAEVWARFGVLLEPEVHAVGDWPPGVWPPPAPS